jgi:hypothetical protein
MHLVEVQVTVLSSHRIIALGVPETLQTPYYDARLACVFLPPSPEEDLGLQGDWEAWVLDCCHGLAVGDLQHFPRLVRQWTEHWAVSREPSIKLCLVDTEALEESVQELLRAWCLDNQVELIDMGMAQAADSDGFTQGWDRIREALEAHQWPDLTLKKRGPRHMPLESSREDTGLPLRSEIETMHQRLFGGSLDSDFESQDNAFAMLSHVRGILPFSIFQTTHRKNSLCIKRTSFESPV